jgi:hypothetical protein
MASLSTPLAIVGGALLLTAAARAEITDTGSERQLSLPSATARLILPRRDWVITKEQRRSDDKAVYYSLESAQRKIIFSVFIERTTVCNSAFTCRELAMKNQSYRDAKDMKTFDLGIFSVSQFYLDQPQGLSVIQANVLASAYVDGYWFDIHISKVGTERPDQGSLIELLKEVSIR